MSDPRTLVSVRISVDVVRLIDHYAIDCGVFRSEAIERLIQEGLQAIKYEPGRFAALDAVPGGDD